MMSYALATLLALCAACNSAKQDRYAEAIEVPVVQQDQVRFFEILERAAKREGLFFRDSSAHMRSASNGTLTFYASLFRPLAGEKEWLEVQVLQQNGYSPWVIFHSAAEEPWRETTVASRGRIISSLRQQWPELQNLPILPSGGVPAPDDLVGTSNGFKIRPDRAAKYDLASNSPFLSG